TANLEAANPPVAIPAVRLDSGRYAAKVTWKPQVTVDEDKVKKICGAIGTLALRACKEPASRQFLQNLVCDKLTTSIEAAGLADGPAGSLKTACTEGFGSLDTYCVALK